MLVIWYMVYVIVELDWLIQVKGKIFIVYKSNKYIICFDLRIKKNFFSLAISILLIILHLLNWKVGTQMYSFLFNVHKILYINCSTRRNHSMKRVTILLFLKTF